MDEALLAFGFKTLTAGAWCTPSSHALTETIYLSACMLHLRYAGGAHGQIRGNQAVLQRRSLHRRQQQRTLAYIESSREPARIEANVCRDLSESVFSIFICLGLWVYVPLTDHSCAMGVKNAARRIFGADDTHERRFYRWLEMERLLFTRVHRSEIGRAARPGPVRQIGALEMQLAYREWATRKRWDPQCQLFHTAPKVWQRHG